MFYEFTRWILSIDQSANSISPGLLPCNWLMFAPCAPFVALRAGLPENAFFLRPVTVCTCLHRTRCKCPGFYLRVSLFVFFDCLHRTRWICHNWYLRGSFWYFSWLSYFVCVLWIIQASSAIKSAKICPCHISGHVRACLSHTLTGLDLQRLHRPYLVLFAVNHCISAKVHAPGSVQVTQIIKFDYPNALFCYMDRVRSFVAQLTAWTVASVATVQWLNLAVFGLLLMRIDILIYKFWPVLLVEPSFFGLSALSKHPYPPPVAVCSLQTCHFLQFLDSVQTCP